MKLCSSLVHAYDDFLSRAGTSWETERGLALAGTKLSRQVVNQQDHKTAVLGHTLMLTGEIRACQFLVRL